MLNKLGSLGGVFAQKDVHPLMNEREFKRILAELPKDNAFKTLDEIAGWLESLQAADDFPPCPQLPQYTAFVAGRRKASVVD
jgi:hypothetical protein